MSLFFHLLIHFSLSLIAGIIVWMIWRKPIEAFLAALCGGFLIDIDHLIDYFLAFGLDFRLDYFFEGYQFLKSDKIFVLFHAWEYGIILGVSILFFKNVRIKSVILGLALGLSIHLLSDSLFNELPLKSYSISYRIANGFSIENLVTEEHYQIHKEQKNNVDFR